MLVIVLYFNWYDYLWGGSYMIPVGRDEILSRFAEILAVF